VLLKARVDSCAEKVRYKAQETNYVQNIKLERQRADELLATVLPKPIVRALKLNGKLPPRRYEDVTVLFCDVVDFTAYSEKNPPDIVFAELEALVDRFEELSEEYRLEKIKTVGDAYMATAGLLSSHDNPVLAAVACGLDMVTVAPSFGSGWAVRVGIDHGPVSAGIMGRSQFQYDVWGDTVNTASRLESHGEPGRVQVSDMVFQRLQSRFDFELRGAVELKGRGSMNTYFLNRAKA